MKLTRLKLAVLLSAPVIIFALSVAPPAAETSGSPLFEPPIVAADGNAVYGSKCAVCHGKDGKGVPAMRRSGAPDFTDAQWHAARTDAQITESVKNGKGKLMPEFRNKLNDEEISAVVARVRRFKR
jgi:cbb3-type cytochrome c oxidase subunit III